MRTLLQVRADLLPGDRDVFYIHDAVAAQVGENVVRGESRRVHPGHVGGAHDAIAVEVAVEDLEALREAGPAVQLVARNVFDGVGAGAEQRRCQRAEGQRGDGPGQCVGPQAGERGGGQAGEAVQVASGDRLAEDDLDAGDRPRQVQLGRADQVVALADGPEEDVVRQNRGRDRVYLDVLIRA